MQDGSSENLSDYIDRVHAAFNKHCEEVHAKTVEKLNATAEDDVEARKKILAEQKAELDKTLSELKELLSKRTRAARENLEKIEQEEMEMEFNLEDQLETV